MIRLTVPRVPKRLSDIEETFALHCKLHKLPKPEREYKFCDSRKWRFDFAWPLKWIAVECEGGHWSGGRHTRGSGFEKDCEKYNVAAKYGWRVFRFTRSMIESGQAAKMVKEEL